jgi:hypothetical protein
VNSSDATVRRVLQLKVRTPTADASQLLPFMKATSSFYQALGPARFRFLHNVDDPAQFLMEIEYETHEALELNRQKVASDPMVRGIIQGWRALTAGAVEVDVYEDVTGAV